MRIDGEALKLLKENKISIDEFQQVIGPGHNPVKDKDIHKDPPRLEAEALISAPKEGKASRWKNF